MALDPVIQRIVLVDAPAVVGWKRLREIDEQHTLGGLRANLHHVARQGRLQPAEVDVLAHMLMAALDEAALLIALAPDPQAALRVGQAAVNTLISRLTRN